MGRNAAATPASTSRGATSRNGARTSGPGYPARRPGPRPGIQPYLTAAASPATTASTPTTDSSQDLRNDGVAASRRSRWSGTPHRHSRRRTRPRRRVAARTSSTERLRASRSASTCADSAERQRAHPVRWASTDQPATVAGRPGGVTGQQVFARVPACSGRRPGRAGKWARHDVPQASRRWAGCSGSGLLLGERGAQRQPGAVTAGLDGAFRHAQQDGRLRAGQAVQHGRLDGAAQFRRQPGQRLTQAAVLDAGQHLVLSRDDRLRLRRAPRQPPPGAVLPADRVDQAADADAPDERGHIPAAAVGARLPPHGEEGVLDGVVDHIRHRAPPRHPDRQPAGVPVIQGGKRLLIAARHGAQQRRVIALPGPWPHGRDRSGAPMHSLSQQRTRPVPIIQDK